MKENPDLLAAVISWPILYLNNLLIIHVYLTSLQRKNIMTENGCKSDLFTPFFGKHVHGKLRCSSEGCFVAVLRSQTTGLYKKTHIIRNTHLFHLKAGDMVFSDIHLNC